MSSAADLAVPRQAPAAPDTTTTETMETYIAFAQNHVALFAALGVAVLLFIANEVHGNVFGGRRLSVAEAVRLINDREPLIIDVRPAADYKRGHLLNAVNIPAAKLRERINERDRSRPVLVYCALGGTAAEAAAELRRQGFTEAYPLRGGINDWLAANLPVTTK
jgi:rhodanese-related sulfurtransferase